MESPPFFDNLHQLTLDDVNKLAKVANLDGKNHKLMTEIFFEWEKLENEKRAREELTSNGENIEAENQQYLSIDRLANTLKIGQTAVRNRLKTLTVAGLIEHVNVSIKSSKRPVSLFRLAMPDTAKMICALEIQNQKKEFPQLPLSRKISALSPARIEQLIKSDSPYTIDNLFCTILFTALSPSRNVTYDCVETAVNWFGESVPVVVRPFKDKPLAKMGDVSFYIGLLTYLREYIRSFGIPQDLETNGWTVPLKEVLRTLTISRDGGNSQTALGAFQRLADTRFELPRLPTKIITKYGWEAAEQSFQPLSNFGIFYEKKSLYQSAHITFQLPPTVQTALLINKHALFDISPDAVRFGHDFLLAMHLWAKRRLGSRFPHWTVDQDDAYREISPTLTYREYLTKLTSTMTHFQKRMESMVLTKDEIAKSKKEDPEKFKNLNYLTKEEFEYFIQAPCVYDEDGKLESAQMNFFGYIINFSPSHLSVMRDVSDPYTGLLARKNPRLIHDKPPSPNSDEPVATGSEQRTFEFSKAPAEPQPETNN